MLDDALPTYSFQQSNENPLHTILYFTHNGSDPSADYILKRPAPSSAPNQYAAGLVDAKYQSVIYGEVLLKPEWTQATLSAAEVRAQNGGTPPSLPILPDSFSVDLYNPDQGIVVSRNQGSWRSDTFEFEIPERSFKPPSASQIDRDAGQVPDLVPKVMFRWKRDGRLSKDMTCYLCGRSVDGKKNKEPDITIALFRGGKNESAVTIYEPNMARVEVQDRKGLEVVLLLSAEIIRDLYVNPRQDPFNTGAAGAGAPVAKGRRRTNSRPSGSPTGSPPRAAMSGAAVSGAAMSGAINNTRPASPPKAAPAPASPPRDAQRQHEIDAETVRLRAMVAEEERQARERERRDEEEQRHIKQMLEQEEKDTRRQREAEIEAETERLRREYGVQPQTSGPPGQPQGGTSPNLPPRHQGQSPTLPGNVGWFGPPNGQQRPQQPPRPQSMGPTGMQQWSQFGDPHQQPNPAPAPQNGSSSGGGLAGKFKLGKKLLQGQGPYNGASGASASGFFGGNSRAEEEKKKKVQKKRSVHF